MTLSASLGEKRKEKNHHSNDLAWVALQLTLLIFFDFLLIFLLDFLNQIQLANAVS